MRSFTRSVLLVGIAGSARSLLVAAVIDGKTSKLIAIVLYVSGLIAMRSCSAADNVL
jgi:hypothetical protein